VGAKNRSKDGRAALFAPVLETTLIERWAEPHPDGGSRNQALERQIAALRRGELSRAELLDLRGANLVDADLSGLDLSGCDLSGADLSRANLEGTRLFGARLVGAILMHARLERAELSTADLSAAQMGGVSARKAGFGKACLEGASLIEADLREASLTGANLRHCDLRMARLGKARMHAADCTGADISRADLREADLSQCQVERARLEYCLLAGALLGRVRGFAKARWIGVDIHEIDFTGAHLCRRFILDQNYLEEFKQQGRWSLWVYRLWVASSDCGRSFLRWGLWTIALAGLFGGFYTQVEIDYGEHETPLSPIYFSVVTLTTLGYGDVLPASIAAQVVAMIEVCIGYVMLGGLLSIFSNRMARRAE
jgi:uncharacterized protein YjbI with pentapeptide repeats